MLLHFMAKNCRHRDDWDAFADNIPIRIGKFCIGENGYVSRIYFFTKSKCNLPLNFQPVESG